jgi:hypothetical protein
MSTRVLHPANLAWPVLHAIRWAKAAVIAPRRAPHSQPDTAALEATKVRAWANKVAQSDPRFAADLYAAADHHERMSSTG